MKAADIPAEVFVIFTDTEWPISFADNADWAIRVRDKRLSSGNVSRPEQVHVWRARLEPIEEMDVKAPIPARLVPAKENG